MREKLVRMLNSINSEIDYENENNLVDNGIFDSLEIMQIVVGIEEKFGVEIDPDNIVPENFNSVETMLELIKKSE